MRIVCTLYHTYFAEGIDSKQTKMVHFRSVALLAAILGAYDVECFSTPSRTLGHGVASRTTRANKISSIGVGSRKSSSALFMSTRPQTGKDFYAILGVNRNASLPEIKSAYRKLAKKYHPGKKRMVEDVLFPIFDLFTLKNHCHYL